MAKATITGPLSSIYEERIGAATNANEVMGYWVFLAGIVLGAFGFLTYYMTPAATMSRGVGYALIALAPALFMPGLSSEFHSRN